MARHEIDDDSNIILRSLDREQKNLLASRGVPGQDLLPKGQKLEVSKFLVGMEPQIPGAANKPISPVKQAARLQELLERPYRKTPYTVGIGSYPSDLRAKYVAQAIFHAACVYYRENRRDFALRSPPLWHRVYGNLGDKLRDKPEEKPSMLFIANLHDESSSTKIEKVRDLLEMYSDVPRIVVSAGQPPCDLWGFRLAYPMNYGIYVGPPTLVQTEV